MEHCIDIAIVGDYNFSYVHHLALNRALNDVDKNTDLRLNHYWFPTKEILPDYRKTFKKFDGIWIAPGPYQSPLNIVKIIEFARENNVPILASDLGFKIMILEFLENLISNPAASGRTSIITEDEEQEMEFTQKTVSLRSGSQIHKIYKRDWIKEYCGSEFSISDILRETLEKNNFLITGYSENLEPAAIELASHPFFIGTIFLPQITSNEAILNPLIVEFLFKSYEKNQQQQSKGKKLA